MKKLLNRVRVWLTGTRRQAVHAALGTLATLAVTAGWIDDSQAAVLLSLAGSTLALAQGTLGLMLLRPSDAARWFGTTGRGLVYGLAAAGGATGVAFGIFGDAQLTHGLAVIAVALTVISSFLGVVNVQTVPSDAEGAPLTRRQYRALIER